jgi:hypothetical protein
MLKLSARYTSSCISDIIRVGAKRSEGIQKHAKQFLKEAYGVTLQLRGHAA